jgi:hypothetical protein
VLVARSFNRLFNLRGTTRFEMENAYRSVDISPPPRSHVPFTLPSPYLRSNPTARFARYRTGGRT